MELIIITRGRVGIQHTLNSLPKELHDRVTIFHPPGEVHRVPQGVECYAEPEVMDYSTKFQWLLDHIDLPFVILDDDLSFSMRGNGSSLVRADREAIIEGFCQMANLLEDYPLVGFHPRAMGNHAPKGWIKNKRINAIQGINPKLVGDLKVDYWPILADMVLNLSLLTRGQENALVCDLFWDQYGVSNAPGGCSLHRTWEQQRDAVFGLQKMFPDFVTIKEKMPKSGWWPGRPRYDFVIQWQRAAEYGRSKKNGTHTGRA